ncbi:hypothetical protein NYS55_04990 [Curtobacterium flaccumfaciens pv. flaccumfaciens]|uniref:hypothetical protein n=1 Tax=Curtobacterium flaccumfaciens TaxID=2035 RepID=UPI00217D8C9D|nr:hypothetical protein [Curtobacterium flaccumfaciens]MCS6550777.1 hypothetical protein [Curtobacterium flaccumfaciens pv. flaccumfaciens]
MDWWNDLTDWTSSDTGWRVLSGAVIPFVAIVVAGVIAALIGRSATKRVVALQERESKNAAVAAILTAARKAAAWGSLGHDERAYADHLAEDADIRLRLLPVQGAPLAANWAQHEIADIKKNSSTFSFQADQSLAEFRDRLLDWQARPSRARKLFKADLERWKFESPDPDADLIKRQQDWNADQAEAPRTQAQAPAQAPAPAAPAERPTPTTTSLRPAQRPASAPSTPPAAAAAAAGAAAPGAASAGAAGGTTPSFSVNRGVGTNPNRGSADQNATRSFGDNTTRVYADDEAAPPVRPALGTPTSPARFVQGRGTDDTEVVDDDRATRAFGDASATRAFGDTDRAPRNDRPSSSDRPVATPTSADSHVNRAPANDVPPASAPRVDNPVATNTTSVPTRLNQAPAEPADANETSEAPYTQPISAAELRRRAADDDE